MKISQEDLYVQEIARLARAWWEDEIDLHTYRAQRARLVDAFEEAINDVTRPYPASGRNAIRPPGGRRGRRLLVVSLSLAALVTVVWSLV